MSRWLGTQRDAVATDRILDAAGTLFATSGIDGTGMGDIAEAAGCSRATLYRYFEDRHALRLAFVHREARAIARNVAAGIGSVDDPTDRFVEAVIRCLAAVRAEPVLLAWFSGQNSAIAGEAAAESEVIPMIGAAFLSAGRDGPDDDYPDEDPDDDRLGRARWTVRVIVSLLMTPEADPGDERALVERFLAPVVLHRSPVRTD